MSLRELFPYFGYANAGWRQANQRQQFGVKLQQTHLTPRAKDGSQSLEATRVKELQPALKRAKADFGYACSLLPTLAFIECQQGLEAPFTPLSGGEKGDAQHLLAGAFELDWICRSSHGLSRVICGSLNLPAMRGTESGAEAKPTKPSFLPALAAYIV